MPRPARGFRFDPEWRTTVFTVVMLPILVGLGFWQLQRAGEKTALAAAWEAQQSLPPAPVQELWQASPSELAYRPVTLRGSMEPDRYYLLDNRIHGGRFGYEVLALVQLDGGGAALVNRGWLAGDPSRQVLPAVPQVEGRVSLNGHVYVAPGKPYLLAEQHLAPGWPTLLQAVEMDKITAQLDPLKVFPYPIRIAAGEPGALTVDWQVVNTSPDKHRGYAVQWFAMAAVLLLFYLLHSSNVWERIKPSGDDCA